MTMTQTMSGAALKVRLGGLGLPPSWFADRLGVTMRTVVRWFDGDEVAPEVAEELEKLSDMTLDEMRKMVAKAEKSVSGDTVKLKTYRTDNEFSKGNWPASWHRALTFRVMEHFIAQGFTVRIEYR